MPTPDTIPIYFGHPITYRYTHQLVKHTHSNRVKNTQNESITHLQFRWQPLVHFGYSNYFQYHLPFLSSQNLRKFSNTLNFRKISPAYPLRGSIRPTTTRSSEPQFNQKKTKCPNGIPNGVKIFKSNHKTQISIFKTLTSLSGNFLYS